MAPNGGHLLVGKTIRLLRLAAEKASRALRDKIPQVTQPFETHAEPIYARVSSKTPVNRINAIRHVQNRHFSTNRETVRHFTSSAHRSSRPPRASYPKSRTAQCVSQLTSRAPFASTLRPNLTGGTLSRTAGGYNIGAGRVNGVRYFSHCPASGAEVIQNVSQAVRAFWISGQKARFNGYDQKTGEKRFRAVSDLQDRARQRLDISHIDAAGSFVDFKVTPTITAIGPLNNVKRCSSSTSYDLETSTHEDTSIANSTLLSTLEVDFARALKDLAAIMNDLKRLSVLGSLPLTLIDQKILRVRFPGCDKDFVESLCCELNIRRGIVGQDPDFEARTGVDMALRFPFAPSGTPSDDFEVVFDSEAHRPAKRSKQYQHQIDWQAMISPAQTNSPGRSHDTDDVEVVDNPWLSSPSGYSSLHPSDGAENDVAAMFFQPAQPSKQYLSKSEHIQTSRYEGLEGIYRFIEECDGSRRAPVVA